jgi:hypothetical protein
VAEGLGTRCERREARGESERIEIKERGRERERDLTSGPSDNLVFFGTLLFQSHGGSDNILNGGRELL